MSEQWKVIPGHPGFEVSSLGRVKALPHVVIHWSGSLISKAGGILKQSNHSGGYSIVGLRDKKKHYVHRLVMSAFFGPAPVGHDVNHIDGNKKNNAVSNLEYCDRLHNVRHAIATGLQDNSGELNGQNKYREASVIKALQLVKEGASQVEASRITGVGASTVQQVVKGNRWKHLSETSAN